jgi:hypothetical protein
MASKKKYLLIHRHEYGISHAIFTAEGFDPLNLDVEHFTKLAKACGLDFEPEKEEELTIVDLDGRVCNVTIKDLEPDKKGT